MNYGFVIDTRSCIGCHACSTACKSENEVPLGVARTWVKTVEIGAYPDSRRAFQVSRCNHCANPPCVRICPVTAMYQRDDGIVEFDSDACIGCKACMQACPYDAIHIDPDTGTAAKCHYCGHRVETGLEPACVVVCPTHSIIAGDLDEPGSEISRIIARNNVTVLKPEQGTAPKLFYIDGAAASMHPTAPPTRRVSLMFTEDEDAVRPAYGTQGVSSPLSVSGAPSATPAAAGLRAPEPQGVPLSGPIQLSPGRMAQHMVQVVYNYRHESPWHWPVPAYLVTKAIGAGVLLLVSLGLVSGLFAVSSSTMIAVGLLSLIAQAATVALLVFDLERPERFLSILTRPQWRSWLTRGAFILIGLTILTTGWWAIELGHGLGYLGSASWFEPVRQVLAWLMLPVAGASAVYTAFLFAQCEGRDLWQSPLLPFHLLVQAVMMGGAGLALLLGVGALSGELTEVARMSLSVALLIDIFVILVGELVVPHASEVAARAAREITQGAFRPQLIWGVVVVGHLLPLALLAFGGLPALVLAGLMSIIGLYLYEHAFVMAPQRVPNS